MTESDNSKTNFAGTYFDRDSVLRIARLANIFAWASLIYYAVSCCSPHDPPPLMRCDRGILTLVRVSVGTPYGGFR